jgi:hypothetical protein
LNRRSLSWLGCAVAATVIAGSASSPAAGAPSRDGRVVKPVPSLTPAATQKLWRRLVGRPRLGGFQTSADCQPLRAVFYAGTDWLRLTTKLAANPSPCAEYYVSVPPLVADKTQPRADQAWRIRALGPAFHALAEINVTGWSTWVSTTGNSWYSAGVEARRRMAAAGYDVAAGDSWALNELSSAVRQGAGSARGNMRAFLNGLYDGDGALPPARGAVFITGMSQATGELSVYQARLQDWYEDEGFWNDMSRYVGDWSQELYGDVRTYAVADATPATRRDALNEYLQHQLSLAAAAPEAAAAARGFLSTASNPLANAAWQYDAAFGWTNVPVELMQDYVSAQTYATRAAGNSRFGFAWAPKNLTVMPATDFAAQTDTLLVRLAAAIADSAVAPEAACGIDWCNRSLAGAAFTTGWRTFATWKPSRLAFTAPLPALPAGTASPALTIELQTSTGIPYTTGLPVTVELASSSPSGAFSTGPAGPWTATLATPIASGSSTTSFYFRDTEPGSPTIVATAAGKTAATQAAVVTMPTDTTAPETTVDAGPGGVSASSSASISFSSNENGVGFECALDGAAFAPCVSPAAYAGLVAGTHTFGVRATDAAGNVDVTPATLTWSVDLTPPNTAITSAPPWGTRSTSATLAFTSTEAGARFECSLDGSGYVGCASPWSRSGLARTVHTFRVRAIDLAGNVDATPATHSWRIR